MYRLLVTWELMHIQEFLELEQSVRGCLKWSSSLFRLFTRTQYNGLYVSCLRNFLCEKVQPANRFTCSTRYEKGVFSSLDCHPLCVSSGPQ